MNHFSDPDALENRFRTLLAELAAKGISVRNREDLERLLAARPDVLAKFEQAMQGAGDGAVAPHQFAEDFKAAQQEEERYVRTGSRAALDSAVAAWSRILQHPAFSSAPEGFRLGVLNDAATVFLKRSRVAEQKSDLERALQLWQQTVLLADPASPHLSAILNNLGAGFIDRFGHTGQETDLDEAIRILRQAVEVTPPDSPNLPMYLDTFAMSLRERYGRTGREADLEVAIQVYRQAVEATASDSPELPTRLNRAGISLSERYRLTGKEGDLSEAIWMFQQAAEATPSDSRNLPAILTNLGSGLKERFVRTGQKADLEGSIRFYRRAVETTLPGSPYLAGCLSNLGQGLLSLFAHSGLESDLEEAIQILEQVVNVNLPGAPDLPAYLNNLGTGLNERFSRMGRETDLNDAIRIWEQAVNISPPDAPYLPTYLSNLGAALSERFLRAGREGDLEKAICVSEQAARTAPPDSPNRSMYLNNWGNVLWHRFSRTGRLEDLDAAIRVWKQAVETTPRNSIRLPEILSNLGNGLSDRFERTGHQPDLEEAILVFRLSLDGTPVDSPNLPVVLSSLGNALTEQSRWTGRESDLEEAIQVSALAVEATRPDSPHLPGRLNILGIGLLERFDRTGQTRDLDEAVRTSRKAVNATQPESHDLPIYLNNLGNGLSEQYARTGRETDLQEAILVYRRACEIGGLSQPQVILSAARNWGRWALERKQWAEAAEAYDYGLTAGRWLLARQLIREHKESWLRDLQQMSGRAAYALSKLRRYQEAAAVVERGRARLLAENLQRRRRDLEHLRTHGRSELYDRYRQVVQRQEQLAEPQSDRPGQLEALPDQARRDAIAAAAHDFEQVVAEIRQVPGYSDFLVEASFAQIQAAAVDTPVAYVLATPAGGIALVASADKIQSVWLDSLTDDVVLEWLRGPASNPTMVGWLGTYQDWLVQGTLQAQRAWLAMIDDITRQLWIQIMQSLAATLHPLKPTMGSSPILSVTLIPVGLLALLPLHAAWTEDASTPTGRRYFLDEFTVNYAPSALALGHARDGAGRAAADHLLAVEEPLAASASPLPNVHAEVAAIAGLFDKPVILSCDKATRRAVLDALPEADVVHFSCHGSNNWQSPLESGMLMADDETGQQVLLTVRDLLESKQAGGLLATLSACETGIVGTKLPDEVVALPSALLQAGFSGVAASLWSVSDVSTAMLMERFYRCWREDKLSPAEALRAAQRWLRDTTNREKAEYFKRYSPELSGTGMPESIAVHFFSQVMSLDPVHRDFEHPFWWAAFYLTGA